jgi:hypothetical protein
MGKLLRVIVRFAVAGILVVSLMVNIALFTGGALYSAAAGAMEAVTGAPSLLTRHRNEVSQLTKKLDAQRVANRRLRSEAAETGRRLAVQQVASRELAADFARKQAAIGAELAEVRNRSLVRRRAFEELAADFQRQKVKSRAAILGTPLAARVVSYGGKESTVGQVVEDTSGRMRRKAAASTARNVGTMPGKALPFFGTAVIVGVTALEVNGWCDTLKDLHALEVALDPSKKPSEEQTTVCALRIPSREELWTSVREAPGDAWTAAREYVPSLENVRSVDLPGVGDWTRETAGGAWDATKGAAAGGWDAAKDGAGAAGEAVGGMVRWILDDGEAAE